MPAKPGRATCYRPGMAPFDQKLLASFANISAAKVAQGMLEAAGIPCRVDDLAEIPSHLFGPLGSVGRSAGIWVLEVDLERAAAVMVEMRETADVVDEAALAAEAMAAGTPPEAEESAPEERMPPDGAGSTPERRSPRGRTLAVVVLVAVLVFLGWSLWR